MSGGPHPEGGGHFPKPPIDEVRERRGGGGHANFNEDAELLGEDRVRVRGPIVWGQNDTGAVIYAMVCQSIGHGNTLAREVAPLVLRSGATEWEMELQRFSGEAFTEGVALATGLAVFTDTEGMFASHWWSDWIHLQSRMAA